MDQVREGRKPGWFWADNKILDVYAKEIGPHATLVYMALVRHLNADGQCWPSFQYLANMLGMSRRTVMRSIEVLDKAGLITVEERYTDKKGQTTNCYTILDMQDITAHEPRAASPVPPVTESHSPHATESLPPVTESHSNKTYMNKTQGTSGGVATSDSDATAALDQATVESLIKRVGLYPSQAQRAVKQQCFTPELIDRLEVLADRLRSEKKKPGAIIARYTDIGLLPDDLPKPTQPKKPRTQAEIDEFNRKVKVNPSLFGSF